MQISKEMIKRGFVNHLVSIEDSDGGCMGICCKIGDTSFYFANNEDTYLTLKEFHNKYCLSDIVDMVYNTIQTETMAVENGIYEDEWFYYFSVLSLPVNKLSA